MNKLDKQQKIELLKQISKPADNKSKWREIAELNKRNKDIFEDLMTMALRIKGRLKEIGIPQKALAKRLDVSPQSLTRIMQGKQNLTFAKIRQIENVLDISLISIKKPSLSNTNMRTQLIPVSVYYNLSISTEEATKIKRLGKSKKDEDTGFLKSLTAAS